MALKSTKEITTPIVNIGKPSYASYGEFDNDNFQVFTPQFIVRDMIKAVGGKIIFDYHYTILEPTSGDGAFVGRILEGRLKKYIKGSKTYLADSVRSISTIYSIEMDKDLVEKQRNNVFSVFVKYAQKLG